MPLNPKLIIDGLKLAATKVNWQKVAQYGPAVVGSIKDLLTSMKKKAPPSIDPLRDELDKQKQGHVELSTRVSEQGKVLESIIERVAQIETNSAQHEAKQTEILSAMAERQQLLADTLTVLSSRIKVLFVLGTALGLLALVALLIAVLH